MPAELGLGSGVYAPTKIKLPTLTSIGQSVGAVAAPGVPKQSRDPYNSVVPPQAGGFAPTTPPGGSASANTLLPPSANAAPGSTYGDVPAGAGPASVGDGGPIAPKSLSYSDMLNSDALYQQLLGNLSAAGIQANQTQQGQTQQAIEQFGEVPDLTSSISGLGLDPQSSLYSMIFGDITPDVQNAADALTKSGLSTTAGLDRTHATDIQSLLDSMAARGTVQSGGTGVGLGQADQSYNQNQFGARTSLINYLTGVQQAFNTSKQSILQQQQQGVADALQRQLGLNPGIQVTGTTPGYVPVTSGNITGGLGG